MLETSPSRGPRPGPAQNTNPTIRSNGGLSPFRDNAGNKIFLMFCFFLPEFFLSTDDYVSI